MVGMVSGLVDRLRSSAASRIEALEAENAALRADAERYRFIRSFDGWGCFDHKRGEALDLAIDKARGKA